jgi:hypothetical protein
MSLNFKSLAVISAVICYILALTWIFFPNLLLALWSVPYSEPVGVVARRGGALFTAIGTIFLISKNAEVSLARYGIVIGFALGCASLALLGLLELMSNHAGIGILSAVIVEIALATAFVLIGFKDRVALNLAQQKHTK